MRLRRNALDDVDVESALANLRRLDEVNIPAYVARFRSGGDGAATGSQAGREVVDARDPAGSGRGEGEVVVIDEAAPAPARRGRQALRR